jgi:hypothetical protein
MQNTRRVTRSADPYAQEDIADSMSVFMRRRPGTPEYDCRVTLARYQHFVEWIRVEESGTSHIRFDAGPHSTITDFQWRGRPLLRPTAMGLALSTVSLVERWVRSNGLPADDGTDLLLL